MKINIFFTLLICMLTSCSNDSDSSNNGVNYDYYYPTLDATITASQIGDGFGKLNPSGIAISNGKLYVCNGDQLNIFNAQTLAFEKTIRNFIKGTNTIGFTKLSSISIEEGRIYVGSVDSQLFILDEKTQEGISYLGNGQWSRTFVHVFGVVVSDGLVFVKEKETTIKVFKAADITETSGWDLAPMAKLNTLNGFDELYSMDVHNGTLVVAGRNAKSYLYYNLSDIRSQAAASLTTPLLPSTSVLDGIKPIAINFSENWALTTENSAGKNYLHIYSKDEFINKKYKTLMKNYDIMGTQSFGNIVSIAQMDDRIFLADQTNQEIKVIKLKKSVITEK